MTGKGSTARIEGGGQVKERAGDLHAYRPWQTFWSLDPRNGVNGQPT
jgi:hypothetical protein